MKRNVMVLLTILVTVFLIHIFPLGGEIGYQEYTVKPGDTLFTVCNALSEIPHGGDVRELIYETRQKNGMETADLQVGETIMVAVYKQ